MGGARLEPAKDSVSIFSCCVVSIRWTNFLQNRPCTNIYSCIRVIRPYSLLFVNSCMI